MTLSNPSRRALLAGAFTAATAATVAPAQKAPASSFTIEKVADGVWAALAAPMAIGNSNSAIFELSDGLLVVDAQVRPSAVHALHAALRPHTRKPVKYVVITHFHGDHWQGLAAYRKLAPQAQFIAHQATRQRMLNSGGAEAVRTAREKLLADAEAQLTAATTPAGKSYWSRMVAESRDFLSELKNVPLEVPAITITRDWTIHNTLQDVQVSFRGPGHTDGDLVVYSPQRRVIATGDLAPSVAPNLAGFPRQLPRTLVAIAQDFPYTKAVPGHGDVQTGPAALFELIDYTEELTVLAERARNRRTVAPAELKSLASGAGRRMGEQTFRWRLQPPQVATPEQALAAAVALNADQVYNAVR